MDCLSPLDGRYSHYTTELAKYMSEKSYIETRFHVELKYLDHLLTYLELPTYDFSCLPDFSPADFDEFKKIEQQTKHDVKAIEIFLRGFIKKHIPDFCHEEYIHFGLTSQDVNSIGFMRCFGHGLGLMLRELRTMNTHFGILIKKCNMTIITKTHGQPAVPSNLAKELYVHYNSIDVSLVRFGAKSESIPAKFGGAIGNMNALSYVYPEKDWLKFADNFVHEFGFCRTKFTTQVDDYGILCDLLSDINMTFQRILRFIKYIWLLISDEYFAQIPVATEVGSSTMPNKINPINFENAKGNIVLGISMLDGIIDVLMDLTYQRDMSDSTVLRSLGSAFGYFFVGIGEICVGLDKLEPNEMMIKKDLDKYAIVIMEGIQTYLKTLGLKSAYEMAKEFSRRSDMIITLDDIRENFIKKLDIDDDHKSHLCRLTPETYVGVWPELTIHDYLLWDICDLKLS